MHDDQQSTEFLPLSTVRRALTWLVGFLMSGLIVFCLYHWHEYSKVRDSISAAKRKEEDAAMKALIERDGLRLDTNTTQPGGSK